MLDLTSFSLGFLVAPVVYVILGAAAYSSFCAGKRLAALLRTEKFGFRNVATTRQDSAYISAAAV